MSLSWAKTFLNLRTFFAFTWLFENANFSLIAILKYFLKYFLLMLRVIVANYSREVLNTNVSKELVESAGRASNPPEFVRVNECSRTVR